MPRVVPGRWRSRDPPDGRDRQSRRHPAQPRRHSVPPRRARPRPAPASSPSSRRTRTATARARWRCALEAAGASMLACADIAEGVSLREAGVKAPVLVFGALSVSDLDGVFEHRLTPTVSSPAAARALEDAAARRGVVVHCHLKIDTGMNRLGFRHDNLRRTMPDVLGSKRLKFDAVYTHFATADDPESEFLEEQRAPVRPRDGGARRARADRRAAACGELRRAPARSTDVVRLGPAGTSALRRRAASARGLARPATGALADQPHRRRQGTAARARALGTVSAGEPTSPARSRSFPRATPTDSTHGCRAAVAPSSGAVGTRSSDRCAWTC